jgi:hypothetical protein
MSQWILRGLSLATLCGGGYLWLWVDSPAYPVSLGAYFTVLCVSALSFVFSRARREFRLNLILTIASVLCTLYGTEMLSRLSAPQYISPPAKIDAQLIAGLNGKFDTRSQIKVITDLRADGIEAWPSYFPGYITDPVYPLGGISLSTTVYSNESGDYMVYKSDEFGFNNPEGLHQTNQVSIALIGDSFTHGCCVGAGEDIGGRLREQGIQVLNLGMGENGPLEELAIFREFAAPLKPKVVLWLYYEENDLADLERELKNPILSQYLEPTYSQQIKQQQPIVDQLIEEFIGNIMVNRGRPSKAGERRRNFIKTSKDLNSYSRPSIHKKFVFTEFLSLASLRQRAQTLIENRTNPIVPEFETIISHASKTVSDWNGQFYFVYLPEWHRFAEGRSRDEAFRGKKHILKLMEDLDVPVIDFLERLNQLDDPLTVFPFSRYGHYTAEGYRLLADHIYDRLNEELELQP